ncbi:hypothetical protein PGB90_007440 [Kerria lacca]
MKFGLVKNGLRILFPIIKIYSQKFSLLLPVSYGNSSVKVITFTPLIYKIQIRCYPKNKNKIKNVVKKVEIREDIISHYFDVDKIKIEMNEILETMKEKYIQNLSLRSSIGSIEAIPVEYEGKKYTIRDLAQVNRKNPKIIALNFAAFPQTIPTILKAISNSSMNLNPQQDGTSVYVPLPKVTKEHRENLKKNANDLFNKCKTDVRAVQIKYIKKLELKQNEGLSLEQFFLLREQITTMANNYISEAEKMKNEKRKELLGDQ